MKINRKHILLFLLITAYLNAVLRPSETSNITAFRVLLPVAWIYIYNISNRILIKMVKVTVLLSCISFLQCFLSKNFFFPEVEALSYAHLVEYLFHLLCIITVVGIVLSIRIICDEEFETEILKFGSRFIKIVALIYIGYVLRGGNPTYFLMFGNINDLGCVFVIGIYIILFQKSSKMFFRIFWVVILLTLLLYNDSKLAFFGAILAIGLYFIVAVSSSSNSKTARVLKIVLILLGVIGIGFILTTEISINSYSLRGMTIGTIQKVLSGQFYSHSSSSQTFRTNVIIALFRILRKSLLLGVGTGNTGLILKTIVPDTGMVFRKLPYMSSHIWWLEVMADWGIIAIIPMLVGYIRTWKRFITFVGPWEKLFGLLCIITFPIWSMSSSGLYTEYFSLSMLTVAVIVSRKPNTDKEEINRK